LAIIFIFADNIRPQAVSQLSAVSSEISFQPAASYATFGCQPLSAALFSRIFSSPDASQADVDAFDG
jgi:hypothetical protein